MSDGFDTNTELDEDRNWEKHSHKKNAKKDSDGRMIPESKGDLNRKTSVENDGGAHGRNNGGDKSGR